MNNKDKAIGVFDSGLGGISVLKDLVQSMPNERFIYFGDSANAPYGIKTKEEITQRCVEIIDFFLEKGVKAIVIACNTATSAAANILREKYLHIPIIGMEPALKVAAEGQNKNTIVVMATPLTLKEDKFNNLMSKYDDNNTVIKMPCPELVNIVENDLLDDKEVVHNQLKYYYKDLNMDKIDSVVLGCTHFVFYREYMESLLNESINIVDGNLGTTNHLKEILREGNELRDNDEEGSVEIYNSSNDERFIKLSQKLLNR
ncbi:MAG: glutamate racemase [Terrisporobacter sp.]|uniref:glutamate racemase n=1 Tax=Terrisporobacter sp. TaxID=1965305 RepID=UPI002FC84DCC